VNKATGLLSALDALGLSPHNVVAIGDAENDHALLQAGEAGVAVNNALPSLKKEADLVTSGDHGKGVIDVIEALLSDDLSTLSPRLKKHDLAIGETKMGAAMQVPAQGVGILVAGTSGGGKSTLAATLIEKLAEHSYQFCIIDPEGDFAQMPKAVALGDSKRPPTPNEVMTALDRPQQNCVVNLTGLTLDDRPPFFEKLFSDLMHLRARTGRPHWLILDEAHHILPCSRNEMARSILEGIDLVFAIGDDPRKTIDGFCTAIDETPPPLENLSLEKGEAMAWWRQPRGEPFLFTSFPPSMPRHRHIRKYAEGDVKLGSFIFRGPESRLQLRAQNLFIFLQIGEGVDDLTWNFHLRNSDYENWFRWIIKDEALADFTKDVAHDPAKSPDQTRSLLRKKIEERYTAPK
jgi:energy-coupling factor transporter ATP-binding protein EcfA2